jgi:hypothetical protein
MRLPAQVIIFGCLLFNLHSCSEQSLQQTYTNFYAETLWNYRFNPAGNFEVNTSGHMGAARATGLYTIKNGTIALFYDEESTFDNTFVDRFYIISPEEIIDKSGRHYWTDLEKRASNWRQIESQNDIVKNYLKRQPDFTSYFAELRLDSMQHIDIVSSGVLKSGNKVLDIHSVVYSHPDYKRDIHPYPLRRYTNPLTGEVFLKNEQDSLVLDTILDLSWH